MILNLNDRSKSELKYTYKKFSGGEPHFVLPYEHINDHVDIFCRITNGDDFLKLCASVNALRVVDKDISIVLYLPYFPGARQDRITESGICFTNKMYADLINDLMLDSVVILDPHSDVTNALVDNIYSVNNSGLIYHILRNDFDNGNPQFINIVAPDAGASKKINDLVNEINPYFDNIVFNIIQGLKHRDVTTGELSGFSVHGDFTYHDCPTLIIDDICDGGGTFLGLSEALRKENLINQYLIVTHGIFSNFDNSTKMLETFKHIYATDSINPRCFEGFDWIGDNFTLIDSFELLKNNKYVTI